MSLNTPRARRPRLLACVAALVVLAAAPAAAHADNANLWIDTNGGTCTLQPTAGAYSDAAACASLSAAYQAARAGDTVVIKAGSYGSQTIARRSALDSGQCVSAGTGCVTFRPEQGAAVVLGGFSMGTNYSTQGSSNVHLDATGGSIRLGSLTFLRAHQARLTNVNVPGNVYMTGGADIYVKGGEFGPYSDSSGTHPEIQAVYNSNPVEKPTNVTFDGGYWHGYNTTNATAHVDCLQIESGVNFTLKNSRFQDCGSVGVRVSYGTNRDAEAPDGLLIENNVFGQCADIPVSRCYYSSELGNGNNVTIRYNTFLQDEQPTTSNGSPSNVTRYGNAGIRTGCQTFGTNITYRKNVWKSGTCSATDVSVTDLKLNADGTPAAGSPVIDRGDATAFPATDLLGLARPAGIAPDAGAFEYSGLLPGDVTPPETTITSGPSGSTTATSASLAFSSSEAGSTFECRLDGGAWASCTSPKAYSSLGVGSHMFEVRATDVAGNTDASPASQTWSVTAPADVTPPETTITSGPSGSTTATSASLAFSSSEAGSTFECRLDGGAWASCTSPKAYSSLADGSHTFNVRATDAAGNVDASPAASTWTVDTTAPGTSISSSPSSPTASTSASLAFSSADGSASFECRIDGGAWASCTSPKAYSSLTDGSHTFNVRAKDAVGNVDATPAAATWTVDTTAPDTSVTSSPSSPTASASASVAFSSADGSASFECRIDGGAWASCTSPKAYSSLTDGSHTFNVRAKDAVGNVDATPAAATWTVDTTAPDTTAPDTAITDQPAASTTSTSASVSFTGSDDVGVTGFACKLDDAAWVSCSSPADQAGLALGDHTFSVRAKDAAGNVDASPATVTWTVVTPPDTTAPDTALVDEPAANTTSTTATFAFTSTEGGSTFECRTDAETWGSCASPHVDNPVDLGAHTFSVRAEDPAGNVDPTPASVDWSVVAPTPAPAPALDTTIVTKPAALTSDRRPTFTLAANVANPAFDCSLDGAAWKACAATVRYSLSYGVHRFRARAKSGALLDTTPASYSWTISRRARAASYSFDVLSTQDSGTTTVQADGAVAACTRAGANGRVAVRITGIRTRHSVRRMKISGQVPSFAVDHGNARIRVSVRRGHRWQLLASRRAAVRDGRFTVRAPRARGSLKVAAVVRCS